MRDPKASKQEKMENINSPIQVTCLFFSFFAVQRSDSAFYEINRKAEMISILFHNSQTKVLAG